MREMTNMQMNRLELSMKAGDEVLSRSRFTGVGQEINDIEWRSADEVTVKIRRNQFSALTETPGEPSEPETESESLEGCTVVGKRRDGAWTFSLAEGTPTDKQAKDLEAMGKDFAAGDNLYPKEPIRIGHDWTVSGADLRGLLGSSEMENLDGELKAKLVGVEKHEGVDCARVSVEGTVTFDFSMDDEEEDEDAEGISMPSMKAAFKLKGDVLRSLSHGQDVLADLSGTLVVEGQASAAGMQFEVGMNGPVQVKAKTDLSPNATKAPLPALPTARFPKSTPNNRRSID